VLISKVQQWMAKSQIYPGPIASIIIVIHNMDREGKRTLFSLSTKYQIEVSEEDYEVIVIDNGSIPPFPVDYVKKMGENFRCFYISNASPSPASAINFGVSQSRGRYVGIIIDGARILTPGVIRYALRAFQAFRNPVVTSLAWHLGPDLQNRSILSGYCKGTEDRLLESIGWPEQGYRLFEISVLSSSSANGWFMPIAESNCLFISRESYEQLGGYDERFDSPGGGLVNLDMYWRACNLADTELVVLLGEGNFHQLHGGIATNTSEDDLARLWQVWNEQYFSLRGEYFNKPTKAPYFLGHIPLQAKKFLLFSIEKAIIA
jgi:glycosyltransferase involved in cell wall biosynthesis